MMIEIEKPTIECRQLSDDNTYAQFVVEPLQRGFGHTLGNSMRRILMSSLPGVAVTSIRINGVLHEFTAIPGISEDVAEIILNIKGIHAKLHSDGPVTANINAKGPCTVTAGDIFGDSSLEIINTDHVIATLSENAVLNMELVFSKGIGYVSAANNKYEEMPIDTSRWIPFIRRSRRLIILWTAQESEERLIMTSSPLMCGQTERLTPRRRSAFLQRS